jgi:hypothetical protein
MELFEQFGITQTMLQGIIVVVIAAIFLGLYWRYVAIGAGMLFVVFVFAYKPTAAKVSPIAPVEVTVPNTPEVKEVEPGDKQVQKWHKEFMEDCLSVTENSKEQCEIIWGERIEDEKHPEKMAVKWQRYKKFRAKYL